MQKIRKYGLIGYPLGHSFSKRYFSEKFVMLGLTDAEYENYPLESIDLFPALLEKNMLLMGLNVTIPYKTSIIRFLDAIDEEASEVGAVNTVKIRTADGKRQLKGYNTDVYGFRESLKPCLESSESYAALILGTGGSSLAVKYVLDSLGIASRHVSRNKGGDNLTYDQVDSRVLSEHKLIINTTPLGMFPEVDSYPPLDYSGLSDKHILYDLVYNPPLTQFLAKGEERGARITGGMRMLELQAERSWEIWNDHSLW